MSKTPITTSKALLLGALIMATALAGCASDTGDGLPWASYEEAKNAPGPTYEANNTNSPVKMKLLQPTDPEAIETGGMEVIVLLYDSQADAPVTDASFLIEAYMPAMGHGTSPETDPVHQRDGIYVGKTTISMPGEWVINLDPQLSDGTELNYDVFAQAGEGGSS